MNQHYGKALGHIFMAFGIAAFGDRDEDGEGTPAASDQVDAYGSGTPPATAAEPTSAPAPKRACCLAKRKVSPLRRFKR